MHGLLVEEESKNYWSVNLQTQFFFFPPSKEGILILYLQKIINHQSGTVEDFFGQNEKRFNIQLFINVEVGWTNLSQDLIVGQGKLIWRYRHVVMLQNKMTKVSTGLVQWRGEANMVYVVAICWPRPLI